jgi:hypothetical protein
MNETNDKRLPWNVSLWQSGRLPLFLCIISHSGIGVNGIKHSFGAPSFSSSFRAGTPIDFPFAKIMQ